MAQKSEFKRLVKLEKGLPKSGKKFLEESGQKNYGGVLAGWYKGDIAHTKNYVLVLNDAIEGTYKVIYRVGEEIKVEDHETLYQTFLAHKAARFNKV